MLAAIAATIVGIITVATTVISDERCKDHRSPPLASHSHLYSEFNHCETFNLSDDGGFSFYPISLLWVLKAFFFSGVFFKGKVSNKRPVLKQKGRGQGTTFKKMT